jgi:hypothetical protein
MLPGVDLGDDIQKRSMCSGNQESADVRNGGCLKYFCLTNCLLQVVQSSIQKKE